MTKRRLTEYRPQERNANQHTPMGLKALETSIQADGWIGAMTAAADGEIFDGSARIETGVGSGFADAVIVESDGTTPIIIVRTDIASADDPRAKRLGLMANRVAELNLSWNADLIASLVQEAPSENATLQALMQNLVADAGNAPPDIDFKEYDESTADDVQYCECPNCGHTFPK